MLIEFRVTNYRSIHETQVLSMVANKDDALADTNCFASGVTAAPSLLRSVAIYGPNASGKSNLIQAMGFMRYVVENSATRMQEGQLLRSEPFRFATESIEQPGEFEMTFVIDKVRYQYGFALTRERVVRECLLAYPLGQPQSWFLREYDTQNDQYNWSFSSHFAGQKKLWQASTRTDALFLSTAVNLNSEQLRPIFSWFVNKLAVANGIFQINEKYTIDLIKNATEKEKADIVKFLQVADLGITNISVEIQKKPGVDLQNESGKLSIGNNETPVIIFSHRGKAFTFKEESEGTRRLFAYLGPLFDVLKNGKVLLVDELDNSLHPKMVRFLIDLIHNPEINRNHAQLIFSTHDTSLLDTELFRRDQIWFVEKDQAQASHLYPLTDFSPRKNEALEKGYLAGRYGALPFFGEFKL